MFVLKPSDIKSSLNCIIDKNIEFLLTYSNLNQMIDKISNSPEAVENVMNIGTMPAILTFIFGNTIPISFLALVQFNSFFKYTSFLKFDGGNLFNFINNLEGIKKDYDS